MSDWRHECGYKEPEECAFCEHCLQMKDVIGGMQYMGAEAGCVRKAKDANGTGKLKYLREHAVSLRGTCRHFRRKP